MPDVILRRETVIVVTDEYGPLPADTLFPSGVLFPGSRYVTNIVAGTLKLDEILAENSPVFGEMYATKFEVQVYYEEDLSGKYIHVYQQNEGVYSDIFSGYIDSCKLDKVGTDRTIVAYDMSYRLRETDVTEWWNYYWNTTIPASQTEGSGDNKRKYSTLGHARNAMLNYLGIEHTTPTLINDSMRIYKDVAFSECSLQQMLSMMCELSCSFPHFDRNGILTFIVLDPTATPIDLSDAYEWMNSDFEDYTTAPVTGIQFYDSEDNAKYGVGTDGNAYPIKKNIFTYSLGTTALTAIANNMLPYLQALIYTPANVKMIVGSFNYELGDYIHTSLGNFFILQNSYSGSQFVEEQLVCKGSEENYSQMHTINREDLILNEKFSRINYSVEGLEVEFGEIHEGLCDYSGSGYPTIDSGWNAQEKEQRIGVTYHDTTNDRYYKYVKNGSTYSWQQINKTDVGVSVIQSKFKQTAHEISLKVAKGTVSSELSLEPGRITLSSGRLIITGGNFKLDEYGNITASNATLTGGTFDCGSDTNGHSRLHLDGGDINFYYTTNNTTSLLGKLCAKASTYTYDEEYIEVQQGGGLIIDHNTETVNENVMRVGSAGTILLTANDVGESQSISSDCYIALKESGGSYGDSIYMNCAKLSALASDSISLHSTKDTVMMGRHLVQEFTGRFEISGGSNSSITTMNDSQGILFASENLSLWYDDSKIYMLPQDIWFETSQGGMRFEASDDIALVSDGEVQFHQVYNGVSVWGTTIDDGDPVVLMTSNGSIAVRIINGLLCI